MRHTCDGRDLACAGCVAMAKRHEVVRAALTADDQLDDITRAQIWSRIEARIAQPSAPPVRWRARIAMATALAASVAIAVAVLRGGRGGEAGVFVAPRETTLSLRLGPAHASLVGPARLDVVDATPSATSVRLLDGTLLAEFEGGHGRHLRISAPGATIEIVGTLFAVTAHAGTTCVSVAHGTVRMTTATRTLTITGGQRGCSDNRPPDALEPAMREALTRHAATITADVGPAMGTQAIEVGQPVATPPAVEPAVPASVVTEPPAVEAAAVESAVAPAVVAPAVVAPAVVAPAAVASAVVAPAAVAAAVVAPPVRAPAVIAPAVRAPAVVQRPPVVRRTEQPPAPPRRVIAVASPVPASAEPVTTPPVAAPPVVAPPVAPPPVTPPPLTPPPVVPPAATPPVATPPAATPPAVTASALYRDAEAALAARDLPVADRHLAALLAQFPDSPLVDQALYERARIAYRRHAWADAQRQLDRLSVLQSSPLAEPGAYLSCRIAFEATDEGATSCLTAYRTRYPRSPHDADVLGMLAELAFRAGGCVGARAGITELTRLYPDTARTQGWHHRCPESP